MPYRYGEQTIREGRSWVDSQGVTHPTNWNSWTDEEKAEIGLVFIHPPEWYDSKFYWSAGVPREIEDIPAVNTEGNPVMDDKGNQVITIGLKTQLLSKVTEQKINFLTPSDGYYTREADNGAAVPISVRAYRQAIRNASETIEAAINGCTTLEDLKALHDHPTDDQGAPIGNAPISDWPVEEDIDPDTYVPDHVSMRQARLVLLGSGMLDGIEASITDPAARIEWEFSNTVERQSTLVVNIASGLSLTEEQIDEMFRSAIQL